MNIQVKLLELESQVEAERAKLSQLRRQHYKTSVDGIVEQWIQGVMITLYYKLTVIEETY